MLKLPLYHYYYVRIYALYMTPININVCMILLHLIWGHTWNCVRTVLSCTLGAFRRFTLLYFVSFEEPMHPLGATYIYQFFFFLHASTITLTLINLIVADRWRFGEGGVRELRTFPQQASSRLHLSFLGSPGIKMINNCVQSSARAMCNCRDRMTDQSQPNAIVIFPESWILKLLFYSFHIEGTHNNLCWVGLSLFREPAGLGYGSFFSYLTQLK
jgi:hypothetical protein